MSIVIDTHIFNLEKSISPYFINQTTYEKSSISVRPIVSDLRTTHPMFNRNVIFTDLIFALCVLRDEIHSVELFPRMNSSAALEMFESLRLAYTGQWYVFHRLVIHAWCYTEEEWATYGYQLLDIFEKEKSFLFVVPQVKQIISLIEKLGPGTFPVILDAISMTLGMRAANELKCIHGSKSSVDYFRRTQRCY